MKRFRKRKSKHGFGNQFSLGNFLGTPFRWIVSKLGGSEDELGQSVPVVKRVMRGLIFIVKFPFWIALQVLGFIATSWTTTRDGTLAMWGAVPMLGIGAVVAIMIGANYIEDTFTRRIHRQAVVKAEEIHDYEAALLASRRVQNITNLDKWRFLHAWTLRASGHDENADAIIEELSDPQKPGFIDAHMYRVEMYLTNKGKHLGLSEEDRLVEARKHLELVLEKEPDKLIAVYFLARVWQAQGETDRAMSVFIRLTGQFPEVVPDLANYLIEKGDVTNADFHIQRGMKAIQKKAAQNPNSTKNWEDMYAILMIKKDYELAYRNLSIAIRASSDPVVKMRIRRLQSNLLVELSRTFTDISTKDGFRRKLIPVCQSIEVFPRNGPAISEFIDLVLFPPTPEIESWLDDEARDNVSPSIFHIINGMRDAIDGKPPTSKTHFELAFDGDNRTAIVVNDIAWMLGIERDRPEAALRIIDVAIDTWPKAAKLSQTRGELLMKMGLYQEALPELEFAEQQIKNDPRVNEVLSDCYEALGKTEEATFQRVQKEKKMALFQEALKRAREEAVRKSRNR